MNIAPEGGIKFQMEFSPAEPLPEVDLRERQFERVIGLDLGVQLQAAGWHDGFLFMNYFPG